MVRIWERFGSTITPIGAALAEAAGNHDLQNTIQYRFQKFGECPTSELFPTIEAVEEFYEHSFGVVGVLKSDFDFRPRACDRTVATAKK